MSATLAEKQVLEHPSIRSFGLDSVGRIATGICLAAALVGCTTTVTTDGWTVSCLGTAPDVCRSAASLALNNLARSRPRDPIGTITIVARGPCAPVPDWADGSMCLDAHVRIAAGREVCLVIARRPALGGYGQVGGDEVSGQLGGTGQGPALRCMRARG